MAPGKATRDPFWQALRCLREERGLSDRALEIQTRRHDPDGKGLGHAYLNRLMQPPENRKYSVPPTKANIELIAAALNLDPGYFLEYREIYAREEVLEALRAGGYDGLSLRRSS
jgi:transcriptional regulator with XRE-family HTH domain